MTIFFKKMGHPGLFFVHFRSFLVAISIIQIEKSLDGVVGKWTQVARWLAQTKPRSYGGLYDDLFYCKELNKEIWLEIAE